MQKRENRLSRSPAVSQDEFSPSPLLASALKSVSVPGGYPVDPEQASPPKRKIPRPRIRLTKVGIKAVCRWVWRIFKIVFVTVLFLTLVLVAAYEIRTSEFQAHCFSRMAEKIDVKVETGKSPAICFPGSGPYDTRLGYVQLPGFIDNLEAEGYKITTQARISPFLMDYIQAGFYPAYQEKFQAGLRIEDRSGQPIYTTAYPERVFPNYTRIPSVIVKILLYIENRELLDPNCPFKNPAIEWKRLAAAAVELARKTVDPSRNVPGGSTLATQIEKYRHSPDGMTRTVKDKFYQMVSASMRAYLNGKETLPTRYDILCHFINSMPLGAISGYGEIMGIGDGLYAWYGTDFAQTVRLLSQRPSRLSEADAQARATVLKQVVSLFVAQRRPSYFLLRDHAALESKTNTYLRLLAQEGIITPGERDAAIAASVTLQTHAVCARPGSCLDQKSLNSIRVRLLNLLGVDRFYELDRFDLSVTSTLDPAVQQKTTELLKTLQKPAIAQRHGLFGGHLLCPGSRSAKALSKVVYSLTLYERSEGANLLRVQTDTLDQPLNINSGTKLELGSTAKLRALATYLEILAMLYDQYHRLSGKELAAVKVDAADRLSRWVVSYLMRHRTRRDLSTMLDAAMKRRYSASAGELFLTGGGRHVFGGRSTPRRFSVQTAFNISNNLVFIRIMRDIVRYYKYQLPGAREILSDTQSPRRHEYLARFADQEGTIFLKRFYRRYKGKTPAEAFDILMEGMRKTPRNIVSVFRYIYPEIELEAFEKRIRPHLKRVQVADSLLPHLFYASDPYGVSLVELGYITRIHPLELWSAAYLCHHPGAGEKEVIARSAAERQLVYGWLFRTSRKNKQNIRIHSLLEVEAFSDIFQAWKQLRYPFSSLVPSYATALGSSADRPDSLAELVGIILNRGKWYPTLEIQDFCFAKETPYETRMTCPRSEGEQVMHPEVADTLYKALGGVVNRGTAREVRNAFRLPDGTRLAVGGKTGTGDNRRNRYTAQGTLISSRAINRTGVFVFYIGKRFYGVITVYVDGPESDRYTFTSALAVKLLKTVAPRLMPLMTADNGN